MGVKIPHNIMSMALKSPKAFHTYLLLNCHGEKLNKKIFLIYVETSSGADPVYLENAENLNINKIVFFWIIENKKNFLDYSSNWLLENQIVITKLAAHYMRQLKIVNFLA